MYFSSLMILIASLSANAQEPEVDTNKVLMEQCMPIIDLTEAQICACQIIALAHPDILSIEECPPYTIKPSI